MVMILKLYKHQNQLEDFLKHRFLGLTSRIFNSVQEVKLAFLANPLGMQMLLVWPPQFENHLPMETHSEFFRFFWTL
jgi:hypothetical protein